tara:strand:+ start:444 stop:1592 length:1149 start_codon:yes stop_codon:yes gene_type:complete
MSVNIKDLELETCLILMNKVNRPEEAKPGYMVYSSNNFLTYDICLTNDLLKRLFNQQLNDDEWMNIQYTFRVNNTSQKGGGPDDVSKKMCSYISKIFILILISLTFGSAGPTPYKISEDKLIDFNCSNPFGITEIEKLDESYIAPLPTNMKLMCERQKQILDNSLKPLTSTKLGTFWTYRWDGNTLHRRDMMRLFTKGDQLMEKVVKEFISMENLERHKIDIDVSYDTLLTQSGEEDEGWHVDGINKNRQAFIYVGDGRQSPFAKITTSHPILRNDISYERPNKTDIWESPNKGCETITVISNYRNIHTSVSRPPSSIKYNLKEDFEVKRGYQSDQALIRIFFDESDVRDVSEFKTGGLKRKSRKQKLKYKKRGKKSKKSKK